MHACVCVLCVFGRYAKETIRVSNWTLYVNRGENMRRTYDVATDRQRRFADRQQAMYERFVVGIQEELPGWRPATWTQEDERRVFPDAKAYRGNT